MFNEIKNNFFLDFDETSKKEHKWEVIVYTESKVLSDNSNENNESTVSFQIIGERGSSEVFPLENMTKKNFLPGKSQKFVLITDHEIGNPSHIVLNFKDNNKYDWVVNKIELIDQEKSKIYTFTFNDRIKKNHDIKLAVDGILIIAFKKG